MKRIKSFLTIMMAAIFALSLVPAGALAAENYDHGEMYYESPYDSTPAAGEGSITIANTKKGETYSIYRIFDLASFNDADKRPGQHAASTDATNGEAYSYVIREKVANPNAGQGGQQAEIENPWWKFLMSSNAVGEGTANYANWATDADGTAIAVAGTQLFSIEREPITLKDAAGASHSDYHVVTATQHFLNAWDVAAADYPDTQNANTANGTFKYDTQDYVDPTKDGVTSKASIKVVQDFAQQALAYARKSGTGVVTNYSVPGNGGEVLVNGAGTDTVKNDIGTLSAGKVPLGWYLMGTTMGTLVSLDTTNKDVTIYEKNQVPELEKKVLKKGAAAGAIAEADLIGKTLEAYQKTEGHGSATYADAPGEIMWVDNTDADVNDLVQFRAVITAKQGVSDYKLHDVMEDGLGLLYQTYTETTDVGGNITNFGGSRAAKPGNTCTDEYAKADGSGSYDDTDTPGGTTSGEGLYDIKVYLVRSAAVSPDKIVRQIKAYQQVNSTGNYRKNWELKAGDSQQADGCDFEILFKDAVPEANTATGGDKDNKVTFVDSDGALVDIKNDDRIVVTYWAQVLPGAVLYGTDSAGTNDFTAVKDNTGADKWDDTATSTDPGQVHKTSDGNNRNTNSTVLTYGANSHTDWKKADVTTYQLEIAKTQSNNSLLEGAKFRLYKALTVASNAAAPTGAITDGTDLNAAIGADGLTLGDDKYYQASKALVFSQPAADKPTYYRFAGDAATATNAATAEPTAGSAAVADNPATPDDETQAAVPAANGTVLKSVWGKEIAVRGLEEGWYLLVEEEAPEGFNKLAHPIAIYVNGDMDASDRLDYDGNNKYDGNAGSNVAPSIQTTHEGQLNVCSKANSGTLTDTNKTDKAAADYTAWDATITAPTGTASKNDPGIYTSGGVRVINNTGAELPSTGGVGTTIFYVAGTVLVVGAVVMLVAKRRMGSEA